MLMARNSNLDLKNDDVTISLCGLIALIASGLATSNDSEIEIPGDFY